MTRILEREGKFRDEERKTIQSREEEEEERESEMAEQQFPRLA